jgi:signal transduction histidine kinase
LEWLGSELAATHDVLVDAIESLPVAFALFDSDDRLIMFNENFPRFTPINAELVEIGVAFGTLVRAGVERGHSIYPQSSVEAKISSRMAQHLDPTEPFERQRTDGTWLLVSERRTSTGGVILVETDITNQKMAEQEIRVLNEDLERRVAERTEELARKHAVLEATFESISEGFALFDASDRLVYSNQTYRDFFAQAIGDSIEPGVDYGDLLRPLVEDGYLTFSPDEPDQQIRRRLAQHREPGGNIEARLADGRWLLLTERRTSDGGVAVVQTDVTEMKKAELALRESEQRFASITANVPGTVYRRILHPDGNITFDFVSDGLEDVFGIDPQTLTQESGHNILPIHTEDMPSYAAAINRSAELLETFDLTFRIVGQSRQITWVRSISSPSRREDGCTVWDGVAVDVTSQKQAQAEIVEKTKLLETARNDAEIANRAKSEFLSRMSHELRTPLNAILGFGEVLQTNSEANLSTLQRQSVHYIVEAGKHLLDLVNEILDLASIEAGKVELDIQAVSADTAINECLNLVAPLASANNIQILHNTVESDSVVIWADRLRFKQVMLNLLSNAIKYSRNGGSVLLQSNRVAGERLRISIIDSGDGISEADQKLIFEPFSRSASHRKSVEGVGIGLAISKQLVEMMRGQIGFDSPPKSGAVFWIELPIGAAETAIDLPNRTNATK